MKMTSNTQICSKCKTEKPLDEFHADRRTTNRKRADCIVCRTHHRSVSNISKFAYAQFLIKQNNCCAICGIDGNDYKREFSVDHNHITNVVRGLLCSNCNIGLGYFKDNTSMLSMAIEYLVRADDIT